MDWTTDFGAWVWARHHNEWSWYVRPLFILPYCWFAWRRSLAGLVIVLLLLPTSLFWFPAPETPRTEVVRYLEWERWFFLDGGWRAKTLLTVAVAGFLWALAAAFWKRSFWLGAAVINLATGLKVAVGLALGGEAGTAAILPALVTLGVVNIALMAWRAYARRRVVNPARSSSQDGPAR